MPAETPSADCSKWLGRPRGVVRGDGLGRAGYTPIFTLAACFLLLGAVLLRNVKGVR